MLEKRNKTKQTNSASAYYYFNVLGVYHLCYRSTLWSTDSSPIFLQRSWNFYTSRSLWEHVCVEIVHTDLFVRQNIPQICANWMLTLINCTIVDYVTMNIEIKLCLVQFLIEIYTLMILSWFSPPVKQRVPDQVQVLVQCSIHHKW